MNNRKKGKGIRMYIVLTIAIILCLLIVIKILTNDMALRLTSIIYKCDYEELKKLTHKRSSKQK